MTNQEQNEKSNRYRDPVIKNDENRLFKTQKKNKIKYKFCPCLVKLTNIFYHFQPLNAL